MARLINISYTYADDNGKLITVNNVDGKQIDAIAAQFRGDIVVSLGTYNKQQNPKTRNLTAA